MPLKRRKPIGLEPHRGLEPGEGKIGLRPPSHRAREIIARRIAFRRLALDERAAGIAEAEHFRDLVEGFADRIIDRRAEPAIIADAFDGDELGMAAGDEQQQIGKGKIVGEPRRQRMAFEMIDGDEGFAGSERQRLRHGEADDDAADKARARGARDRRRDH